MSQVIRHHTMTLVHRDFGQHLRCTLFNKDCCCTPFTRIGIVQSPFMAIVFQHWTMIAVICYELVNVVVYN